MRSASFFLLTAVLAGTGSGLLAGDWVTPPVEAPGVRHGVFESEAAGARVSYHLYLPDAYEAEPQRQFPVLYWLHGTGGGLGGIAPISGFFDQAIRRGRIPPMLVAFPNGLATSFWCDSKDGAVPMETVVVKELIPHLDAAYRTVASPEGRLVEGFSMGGYGAARLGFFYPDVFGAVSILAGGPFDLDFQGPRAQANPAERERILQDVFGGDLDRYRAMNPLAVAAERASSLRRGIRLRIVVGDRDAMAPGNRALSRRLESLGLPHDFTAIPGADHEPMPLLRAFGEEHWNFYREPLAPGRLAGADAAAVSLAEPAQSPPAAGIDLSLEWVAPEVDIPGIRREIFRSAATGAEASCYLLIPEAYERESERRFPVIYWLHGGGGGGGRAVTSNLAPMARHFGDAIRGGRIPPVIVVFPNGLDSLWIDSKNGRIPMGRVFLEDLLPHLDANFRTHATREGRLVEGYSMGGYGAAHHGFKRPDLFAAVSILAGGPLQPEFTFAPRVGPHGRERVFQKIFGGDPDYFQAQSPWDIAGHNAAALAADTRIRVVIGDRDEMLAVTRDFAGRLRSLGIPHSYTELPGVPHHPMATLKALGEANWEFYREVLAPFGGDDPETPGGSIN